MDPATTTVGLLFGGQSAEHEVSLLSAANVRQALQDAGFPVTLIAVARSGAWFLVEDIVSPETLPAAARRPVTLAPGRGGALFALEGGSPDGGSLAEVDLVFPILHGPYGEDGSLQGLLKLANLPYVGPGILGSAVAMDKAVAKRLLREAGLPVCRSLSATPDDAPNHTAAVEVLGETLVVKPVNLGSSVGVSKVPARQAYGPALDHAFRFDHRVLIEECIDGREIECAVLTLDVDRASLPGEIVPTSEEGFYSYDAKYIDGDGATLHVPADLPVELVNRVQALSLEACRALVCEGMARVDFFLTPEGGLLINEINTLPGFTAISMYPKLWEASGVPPAELATHLVAHAMARFERDRALETHR